MDNFYIPFVNFNTTQGIGKIVHIGQTEPKLYVYTTMVKFVRSKKAHI